MCELVIEVEWSELRSTMFRQTNCEYLWAEADIRPAVRPTLLFE